MFYKNLVEHPHNLLRWVSSKEFARCVGGRIRSKHDGDLAAVTTIINAACVSHKFGRCFPTSNLKFLLAV